MINADLSVRTKRNQDALQFSKKKPEISLV